MVLCVCVCVWCRIRLGVIAVRRKARVLRKSKKKGYASRTQQRMCKVTLTMAAGFFLERGDIVVLNFQ